MQPQWSSQMEQFRTALEQWRTVLPNLPASFPTAQGLSLETHELTAMLEEDFANMNAIALRNDVNGLLLGLHQQGPLNAVAQISSLIGQLQSSPSPGVLDQIAQNWWNIKAGLIWIAPPRQNISGMEELVFGELTAKADALKSLTDSTALALQKALTQNLGIEAAIQGAKSNLELIKAHERESSTARTNAEASATTIVASKELIEKQLAEITAGQGRQEKLLLKIDDLHDKAKTTLESSSRVALAASFAQRVKSLQKTQFVWVSLFFVGILVLALIGSGVETSAIRLPIPFDASGKIDYSAMYLRAIAAGPVVWFTWFCARQYGLTTRLIEDYAFKEASALAFVGYQREMTDDGEMIKLLRESAIQNFGSPPMKIFGKPDPSSPMHELLDKALDKGAVDKFMDLVKALKPGSK